MWKNKVREFSVQFFALFSLLLSSASIMRKEFIMAAPIDDKRRPCVPVGQVDT
jgi:hypothetical protein